MATKQSKGKLKNQKLPDPPKEKKERKIRGYKVLMPVWIRKVQRYPGYVLTAEDISEQKLRKAFDLNLNRKVIEAF